MSAKAGRNARCTTAHENNVARPDTTTHSSEAPSRGQTSRGYQTYAPHDVHRVTQSAPRAAPSKNGAVEGSSTSGNGKSSRLIAMRYRSPASTSVLAMWPV
jgi:hypothetical protein